MADFESLIIELGDINFKQFIDFKLNMKKIEYPYNDDIYFKDIVNDMIKLFPLKGVNNYLTIDSKKILKGQSHRYPGPHIDGNYLACWHYNDIDAWKTINRFCPVLIASSYPGCKVYLGNFVGHPKVGGDCSHLIEQSMSVLILKPNTVYYLNKFCIHESLIMTEDVERTLIRISLSEES